MALYGGDGGGVAQRRALQAIFQRGQSRPHDRSALGHPFVNWGGQTFTDLPALIRWMQARGEQTNLGQFLSHHQGVAERFGYPVPVAHPTQPAPVQSQVMPEPHVREIAGPVPHTPPLAGIDQQALIQHALLQLFRQGVRPRPQRRQPVY